MFSPEEKRKTITFIITYKYLLLFFFFSFLLLQLILKVTFSMLPTQKMNISLSFSFVSLSILYFDQRLKKFPQIRAHPWNKVFRPRTPPEAIHLASKLLEYTPSSRITPLEACAHAFFDELREPNNKLPNGRELPPLFNLTPHGI